MQVKGALQAEDSKRKSVSNLMHKLMFILQSKEAVKKEDCQEPIMAWDITSATDYQHWDIGRKPEEDGAEMSHVAEKNRNGDINRIFQLFIDWTTSCTIFYIVVGDGKCTQVWSVLQSPRNNLTLEGTDMSWSELQKWNKISYLKSPKLSYRVQWFFPKSCTAFQDLLQKWNLDRVLRKTILPSLDSLLWSLY